MKKSLLTNTLIVSIAICIFSGIFSACSKNEDGVITDKTELLSLMDSCQILLSADTTGYSPAAKMAYSALENELIIVQISLINTSISQKQVNIIISGLKITKTTLETTIAISVATNTTAYLQHVPIEKRILVKDQNHLDLVVHHTS